MQYYCAWDSQLESQNITKRKITELLDEIEL